jgi:hypothetical protein
LELQHLLLAPGCWQLQVVVSAGDVGSASVRHACVRPCLQPDHPHLPEERGERREMPEETDATGERREERGQKVGVSNTHTTHTHTHTN